MKKSEDTESMINEPRIKEGLKKPMFYFLSLFILFFVIIVLVVFLFKGSKNKIDIFNTPKLNQMQDMVNKIKTLETDIQIKRKSIFTVMKAYKEKTGNDLPVGSVLNLSLEEKKILERKITEEQSVSIKSLIKDLLNRNRDISILTEKIRDLEELLPTPFIVREGQNHYLIAMNYLVNNKGLRKKKAQELVERSMLYDTLLPGFKIWNFYSGDEFGTFITQGEADISPNVVRRKAKKKLVDSKDKAIAEKEELASEIQVLKDIKDKIVVELNLLNNEKRQLLSKLNTLTKKKHDFQLRLNSLFYLVDLERNLKERGILKGGFLASVKLDDISPSHFRQSIDLREHKSIVLSARHLQIDKIDKIKIYPKYFKLNVDYSIKYSENGKTAVISLLSIGKMKNERAVLSIN